MLFRKIPVVLRPNDSSFDLVHISALQDPIAAQGRKPLYWVKRHAWIAPWAARVVNAYGFVYFGLAVHRLRRRERDFPEWDVNVPMQFSSDVNSFGIWEVVAASGDRGFGTVIFTHRCTEISRDPSTSLGMTKSGTQISGSKIIRVDSCPFVVKQKAMRGRAWLSCQSGNRNPRSLRRHYPHQVQGVCRRGDTLSHCGSPAVLLLGQNRTRTNEVNTRSDRRSETVATVPSSRS